MADEFVQNILREWNMSDLIDIFQQEEIDAEAFRMLDTETINNLIQKAGPRIKFKSKLKAFTIENWVATADTNTITPSTSFTSTSLGDISCNETDVLEGTNLIVLKDSNHTVNSQSFILMPPPPPVAGNYLNIDDSQVDDPPLSKKSKKQSIFPTNLESLLKNSNVNGRLILAKKPEGSLSSDALRNKLALVIVTHLISQNNSISSATFIGATEEIVELFPREEKGTYYVPYKPKSGTHPKIAPSGKLYSQYVKLHSSLNASKKWADGTPQSSSQKQGVTLDEATKEALQYLESNVQPWDKIIELWEVTFDARREQDLSIADYFRQYPALTQNKAVTLFEVDFKHLFPGKEHVADANWHKISNAIQAELNKRKVKTPFTLGENVDSTLVSLIHLPYLFPPITIAHKRRHKNWRPSRVEIQESFFLCISNIGQLEEKIEKRKQNLMAAQCTLQPFFVCVGNIEDNVELDFYIIVNDVKYKVNGHINALDLTFKCFHSLGACYPAESAHVWMFIQKILYNIDTDEDHVSSATSSLISEIKGHLQ